jgi:hypothetical protein
MTLPFRLNASASARLRVDAVLRSTESWSP